MAKKRKLPKAPKASASLEVHKRHAEKVKEVLAYNRKLEADKVAKKKLIESNKKLRASAK